MWGRWILGLASALSIKLSSSVDDVVWLAPFLTTTASLSTRLQNSSVYIGICMIQTLVAWGIAFSGRKAFHHMTHGHRHAWSTEKIMTVIAGVLLALYTLKLVYEYVQELREEAEGDGKESGAPQTVELAERGEVDGNIQSHPHQAHYRAVPSDPMPEDLQEKVPNPRVLETAKDEGQSRQQALCCIAFIGSVDDLTLFVPMLVGRGFDIMQLCLGAFIAASSIVLLCCFIGLCKPIADALAKIPLFLIVAGFAVFLLIKGATLA
mmetsp:Transcript_70906/g.229549  ORF Transcript_70906/g.229549 Transcript_70906/m.229549 type:complete len:265 (-) Transcript_70906:94-888(-)